jgi:hypothetical protein
MHRRWLQGEAFRAGGKRFICVAANYLVKETIQTCAPSATVTPNWILNRKCSPLESERLLRLVQSERFQLCAAITSSYKFANRISWLTIGV